MVSVATRNPGWSPDSATTLLIQFHSASFVYVLNLYGWPVCEAAKPCGAVEFHYEDYTHIYQDVSRRHRVCTLYIVVYKHATGVWTDVAKWQEKVTKMEFTTNEEMPLRTVFCVCVCVCLRMPSLLSLLEFSRMEMCFDFFGVVSRSWITDATFATFVKENRT